MLDLSLTDWVDDAHVALFQRQAAVYSAVLEIYSTDIFVQNLVRPLYAQTAVWSLVNYMMDRNVYISFCIGSALFRWTIKIRMNTALTTFWRQTFSCRASSSSEERDFTQQTSFKKKKRTCMKGKKVANILLVGAAFIHVDDYFVQLDGNLGVSSFCASCLLLYWKQGKKWRYVARISWQSSYIKEKAASMMKTVETNVMTCTRMKMNTMLKKYST